MSKTTSKTTAAAAAPERETTKVRPRKSDAGHTAVSRTSWTTKGGNDRACVLCQCGESWEAYGDRADKAHAKHRGQYASEAQGGGEVT